MGDADHTEENTKKSDGVVHNDVVVIKFKALRLARPERMIFDWGLQG